jgi:hypothetical protein
MQGGEKRRRRAGTGTKGGRGKENENDDDRGVRGGDRKKGEMKRAKQEG